MSNLKKSIHPVSILAAAVGFLLFLPDLDSFAAKFRIAPYLLGSLLPMDDGRVYVMFPKLVCVCMMFLCATSAISWLKNLRLKLFLAATAALIIYGWGLQLMAGMPLGIALRSNGLMGIYVMTLTAVAVCGYARKGAVVQGLGLGMVGAAGLRLIYALYAYGHYGGVEIVEGTPALAMDGGLLILWGFVAVWAGFQAVQCYFLRRFWRGAILLVVMAVFSAAVAASFRRTAMLLLLGNLGLGMLIYFWFRNRLLAGMMWVGGASIAGILGLFLVMVTTFGLTTAKERVFSFSDSGNTTFSSSNESYLDDQNALFEIMRNSHFIGVGPGMSYGVNRLADDFSDDGITPLHTGTSELWASFGLLGVAYHLLILIVLPLACVRAYRRNQVNGSDTLAALAASELLFMSVWPFAPPFYYGMQSSILMGICLGYLFYAAGVTSPVSRLQLGRPAAGFGRSLPASR